MQRDGADALAFAHHQISHAQLAHPPDLRDAVELRAQRLRNRGPGVQIVDVHASRAVVPWRRRLLQAAALARPADAPAVHLADAARPVLAQQPRERRLAQAAPRGERVGVMVAPVIAPLVLEGCRDRHLRHDGRPAASDQAALGEQHRAAAARGLERRVHAGAAGPDHENVAAEVAHCFSSRYYGAP